MKKKSSFMRNISGGACDEYRNIAQQYICPNPNRAPSQIPKSALPTGGRRRRTRRPTKRRSLDNLMGGNCDNGYLLEKTDVNRACAPNDGPNPSQTAWSRRYQAAGGDGYSLMPDNPVGGEPGFMRYSDSCRPIFPSKLTTGGRRRGQKEKKGLITSMAYLDNSRKLRSKTPKSALKEANTSNTCTKCSFSVKMGGNGLVGAAHEVGRMLAPLGANALAGAVALLFMDEMLRKRKITSKKQLGGSIGDYVSIFLPMGKNSLVALASILLLNHYVVKKNSRKHRTHKGGNLIMADVGKLLAPLGVNAVGSSLILLLLSRCVSSKTMKKQQKGGGSLQPLIGLIAPLGMNMFIATGILASLSKMFNHKSAVLRKKHHMGLMAEMRRDLKKKLSPFMKKHK